MNKKYKTRLDSAEWILHDTEHCARHFTVLGFETVGEIVDLKVFDLLNLNRIDNNRAEEMLLALYGYLNLNQDVDEDLYYGFMDQYFDFARWRKMHKYLSKVRMKDIVMAHDVNKKAVISLFNKVSKDFYRREEYDTHQYRYLNKEDLYRQNGGGTTNDE